VSEEERPESRQKSSWIFTNPRKFQILGDAKQRAYSISCGYVVSSDWENAKKLKEK
jgi:hypothetical protein